MTIPRLDKAMKSVNVEFLSKKLLNPLKFTMATVLSW